MHGPGHEWIVFFVVLILVLLLVRHFLRLPQQREDEDTSKQITIPHGGKRSNGSNCCESDSCCIWGAKRDNRAVAAAATAS